MENVLTDQIFYFFENIFSKYQTGFRKVLNPQSCLVAMIEKFKKSLDQGVEYAELLMDLPKAFDCLPHNLIIAKFHAYEFDKASLRLTHSYLTGIRKLKSIIPIAFGCLKVQFWIPYYLIYFYVICSS